jgi:hypothetical protein
MLLEASPESAQDVQGLAFNARHPCDIRVKRDVVFGPTIR